MKIAIVLPTLTPSGGVAIALQYSNLLQENGNQVNVINLGDRYTNWMGHIHCQVIDIKPPCDELLALRSHEYDCVISTYWSTIQFARENIAAIRRYVLVQGVEEDFFEESDFIHRRLVRESWMGPEIKICVSSYLQREIEKRYGLQSFLLTNTIPEYITATNPFIERGQIPRILIEGAHKIPLKRVYEAYNLARYSCFSIGFPAHIWIVSNQPDPLDRDIRPELFLRMVPVQNMASIYSSCDLLLKLSFTEGFGLAPLEAMACGCIPIVNDFGGQRDYFKHLVNGFQLDDSDLLGSMISFLHMFQNSTFRMSLKSEGLKTSSNFRQPNIELLLRLISP